ISSPRISSVYGPDAEYLNMAFRFPGANSKEAMMLELMSNVLSNGSAGLLDLNLVKKQQVLSASAGAYQLKDYSVLFLEGKARIGQDLENVKERLLEQIAILRTGQFDEAILKSIINNYRKSLIQQQESNTGRAFSLLRAFTSGVEWDRQVAAVNEMSKLTKKDIVAFCNKWLNNNYVCVYKRNGTDSHTQKIVKPAITPVEVNREAQSEFLKSVAAMEARDIQPKFVDFKKDIQSHTFSSNAQQVPLLLVPNITNRLFTQYYYIEAGSMHNKLFPIAMEYLQYLGTDRYSADEISQKFYALACEFGINAAQDESYVYLNGLQENYADGLALFEHLLKNCKADPRALHQMIEDMKKKRSDQKLNRNSIRAGLRYYAQYGARNPFNNVLSNAELDGIKADELIRILHSLTSYPHQILYYGPATLPELTKTLSIHHPLVKQFTPLPVAVPYTFTRQTSNEVLFADYDMVQAEIQWFRNGNVYDPKKVPVMTLFNEYFGGNMSGIVFQEIRESKALAYSTYATVANPRKQNEPVYSLAYVGCQADKMKEAVDGMQELLNHLPASEKLFSNSQKSIRNSISVNRVTKTDLLFNYLNARRKGLDHDLNKDVLEQVSAMTFKDIDQFHRQQLSNQMYTLAVLGSDSKMNWDILNRFGTVKKLTLEQIFGY
ncbi:MAG TPA: insulinase family protein, partial [Chitinophagaceae bacterium]|nr:insulinase family protein [Chitinophagaceae bacterium]